MNHTLLISLFGGTLLGLSTMALLLLLGRVAGVGGIFAGLYRPRPRDTAWRALFVAGLVLGGVGVSRLHPELFAEQIQRSSLTLVAAGVLVGFGVRLANGCTSGHGICGIGRLAPRSFVACAVFVGFGMLTVAGLRQLGGVL